MAIEAEPCKALLTLFSNLGSTDDHNIAPSTLSELGIDAVQIEIEEETAIGGKCFGPMSEDQWQALPRESVPKFSFNWPRDFPSIVDAEDVSFGIYDRMTAYNEEDGPSVSQATAWKATCIEDEAEDRLVDLIPFRCIITQLFEIPNYPHRTCVSCHEARDATGLIRSELMLLVGMIIIRIFREEKEFIDDQTFPVLMVSINGREARLIQAHLDPAEQRIKIRYSQLFDFDNCPQEEVLDLFARWMLSEPLSPDTASSQKQAAQMPSVASLEVASPMTPAYQAPSTPRAGRIRDGLVVSPITRSPQPLVAAM